MKFSIVMAYFNNRKEQTINTLNSIKTLYHPLEKPNYDFELVIVDDNCEEEHKLNDIINNYPYKIKYIEISKEEKGTRINPCLAYNKGFEHTEGDIIIIQNPECMHVGDLLLFLTKNFNPNDYFAFSCFSTNNPTINDEFVNSNFKFDLIYNEHFLGRNNPGRHWINHPIHRPVSYHFCNAIYKDKLNLLGGFDHSYAEGYCYDDDEFLFRIKHNLKLNVINIPPDNVFVVHQYHINSSNTFVPGGNDYLSILFNKNKKLFEELKEKYI